MRRFLAYVIMMITIIGAVVFNTQSILENKKDALEYGTGIQLVYSLEKRNVDNYDNSNYPALHASGSEDLSDIDIEKLVMDRLDDAGVRNAEVSIVQGNDEGDGYQLKVSLSPLSDLELSNVKQILSFTGSLSIGTIGDDYVMYADASSFFDYDTSDDFAEIIYNGTTPYPSFHVKSTEAYDDLKSKAEEAANNHSNDAKSLNTHLADESETSEDNSDATTVYLWMNKTIDDTYAKAFGTDNTVVMEEVKNKVIAKIDLNNWDSDDLLLEVVSDLDGNAFSISKARNFVNMLNSTDYGFDIEFLYQNNVSAEFGNKGNVVSAIVGVILVVVACVFLIVRYALAGIGASVNLLATIVFSFFLFSFLGFEYSVAAFIALVLIGALSMFISINYFEKVKNELKKDRSVEKANREGYHKAFFTNLDASLVALFGTVFTFLCVSGPFKTFFGVSMVGVIFAFLINNFFDKWMLYWLTKDSEGVNLPYFFFKKSEEKKDVTFVSLDKKAKSNLLVKVLPIVAAVLMIVALPVGYVISGDKKSFFNLNGDFSSGYTLNIQFQSNTQEYEELSNKTDYLQYIVDIGKENSLGVTYSANDLDDNNANDASFGYYSTTAHVNIVEKTDEENNKYYLHYFSVTVDRNLENVILSDDETIIEVIQKTMEDEGITSNGNYIAPTADSHYENDSLTLGCYRVLATNVSHNTFNLFLGCYLISVFCFAYFLLRYLLSISFTTLATGTLFTTLSIALTALLRIPYSSFTAFAICALALILNIALVFLLAGNKEILKEKGLRDSATNEEKASIINSVASKSLRVVIPVLVLFILTGVGMLFINVSTIGLGISLIVESLLAFVCLYFFALPLYLFFTTHLSSKKIKEYFEKRRAEKGENKTHKDGIVYVDQNGPHETIVPGLNDFLF